MANNLNENLTKYLDYNGLGQFLVKLKEYIADKISEVNGSNLNLYNSGETNPTIASEIEKIWTVLGEGGDVSISSQIQSILDQYVKDIQQGTGDHADLDDLIKVSVVEGTEGSKGIYTISLVGTGLVEKLQDLTSERVSSIDATGTDGGAVTLSIDKSKGDVKLTVNSKALTERVETLESRSGKYNSSSNITNGYLLGGANAGGDWSSISSTSLKYSIGSHGIELGANSKLTIGSDFYGGIILGTTDIIGKAYINIAPEHSTGGITIGSDGMTIGSGDITIGSGGSGGITIGTREQIKIGSDGDITIGTHEQSINIGSGGMTIGSGGDITIGTREQSITIGSGGIIIGTNNNYISIDDNDNYVKLKGQQINLDCGYGVKINEVIVGTSENSGSPVFPDFTCIKGNLIGVAQDSLSLGGQLPSYYATKSDLDSTNENIQSIQSSYVKDITTSNSNTGTKYVTISPNTATQNNVTITIDDTAAKEKFESIDNYTINGKKISGSPTLTGDDITLGKSVGDNTNYPTTMDIPEAIQKLRETMTGLGKVVNLSGVYEKWEDYTNTPVNGDFVIVGQKEYVYWDKWIELGDTTQVTQYLNDLINKYNSHTHSFTPTGTVTSTFAGTQNTTSSSSLNISYTSGRLIIKSSHTHTVTPTGTVTSTFNGGSGTSGPTGLIQSLPPVEPSAPDSFNPGEGDSPEPEPTIDYSKEHFTLHMLEDGDMTLYVPSSYTTEPSYSVNEGEWTTFTSNITLSLKSDDKVRVKCITGAYQRGSSTMFNVTGEYEVYGNVMSLLYGDNFEGQTTLTTQRSFYALFSSQTTLKNAENLILPATTLASECYASMFDSCTSLTSAPVLPATKLVSYCYSCMFQGCSKLNKITMLATNISSSSCLDYWVYGVASSGTFIKHPNMTSLSTGTSGIPNGWVVYNLTPSIINIISTPINFQYIDGIFTPNDKPIILSEYFTEEELLSVQPECDICADIFNKNNNTLASDYVWVNSMTLNDVLKELNITDNVFNISVIIKNVYEPEYDGFYYYYDVEENIHFPISFSNNIQCSINGSDWRWLNGNTLTDEETEPFVDGNYFAIETDDGDIYKFKGNLTPIEYRGIGTFTISKKCNVKGNIMSLLYGDNFEGQTDLTGKNHTFYWLLGKCINIVDASELILPATTLANSCYDGMFSGCTSLTTAPELPATTLANYCYDDMFSGCTSLTTAPELPATTLAIGCYYEMFQGCTSLTTAPELPATTLAIYCYQSMFAGCSKLNKITMLATHTNPEKFLTDWVNGVASTGTFVKNVNMKSLLSGSSGIPSGWTVVDYGS